MKIDFTEGSEKQKKWAQGIVDSIYVQLDCMEYNVNNAYELGLGNTLKYTNEHVAEVRKFFDSTFSQVAMRDAAHVISIRNILSNDGLEKLATGIARDNKKWDDKRMVWVDRK